MKFCSILISDLIFMQFRSLYFSMTENADESPEGPATGSRMTRLRARGGVPTRPPIIDEDDEDLFMTNRRRKLPKPLKEPKEPREPKERQPRAPREPKNQEPAEDRIVREREITTDENSLFWILRYSKNTITVTNIQVPFINHFNFNFLADDC